METKPWYLSKGIIGGLVSVVVGVLAFLGHALPDGSVPFLTDQLTKVAEGALAVIGGITAIYGRLTAQKRIGR